MVTQALYADARVRQTQGETRVPKRVLKVVAYITHERRLLVFRHVREASAGIQVPAGTVEEEELPEIAVMREAVEETGLDHLVLERLIGEQWWDPSGGNLDQIHHRYFYHLRCTTAPPETWQHVEKFASDGSGEHLFEFFWASLPDGVPDLAGEQGFFLPNLTAALSADPS